MKKQHDPASTVTVAPVREAENVALDRGWQQGSTGLSYATYISTNINPAYSPQRFMVEHSQSPRFVVPFDPQLRSPEKILVIKHVYRFAGDAVIRETLQLEHTADLNDEQQQILVQLRKIAEIPPLRRQQRYEVTVQYRYTYDEVYSLGGGAIYSVETDFLIVTDQFQGKVRHPYTKTRQGSRYTRAQPVTEKVGGFVYRISINDPNQHYGPRYVVMDNRVYRVAPVHDPTRPEGVYLCRSRPASETGQDEDSDPELQEAVLMDNYDTQAEQPESNLPRLYRSYNEAMIVIRQVGVDQASVQLDMENAKLREKAGKHQLELERSSKDLEMANLRNRELELKIEENDQKHRTDMEALARKDRYEALSYARKDSSESFKFSTDMIKYVPILLVGLGAAYVAIRTISKG